MSAMEVPVRVTRFLLFLPVKNCLILAVNERQPSVKVLRRALVSSLRCSYSSGGISSSGSSFFYFFCLTILVKFSGSSKSLSRMAKKRFKKMKFPMMTRQTKNIAALGP